MTSQDSAMAEPLLDPRPAPAAPASPTRPFYWSVRRELWENRSIYLAPLSVAAVIFFAFTLGAFRLPARFRAAQAMDLGRQAAAHAMPYHFAAAALILTGLIVGVVYSLGALHGERRDRSILFWKSLPVSDLTAVLAKAVIPLAAIPLVTFAVVLPLQFAMRALSTAVLWANGLDPSPLWVEGAPFEGVIVLAYGLAVLALWHAPVFAWLLLVSGWAKRVSFLWAVLPPVGLCIVEKVVFDTHYVAAALGRRLYGGFEQAFVEPPAGAVRAHGGIPAVGLAQLDPLRFLTSPEMWLGLILAALFLALAVRQRRDREPI
jgi:ABC-2 type transport system permease protein